MIELLVVIIVIGILISSILVAGSALITRSKINNTKAIIEVVLSACEEFKNEQTARPTLTSAQQDAATAGKKVKYIDRYGQYPPDELEVFTPSGLPGSRNGGSLAYGKAAMVPAATGKYPAMTFFTNSDPTHDAQEHRDLAAMIVAIEAFGQSSASILDKIPDKNRTAGVLDASGNPAQFLDRPDGAKTPDGKWGPEDLQIRYIVDEWGNPLSYFAERDFKDDSASASLNIPSSNHDQWNKLSSKVIRASGGQPVIMSYGPDGKEQLKADSMGTTGAASLPGDYSTGPPDNTIDNPLNADNIYSAPGLAEKLAKGL